MKYWAYLNDDVSQKAYTEAELQQLPGFGPDILVCSEVSAVSAEPDWRPVKELLPHLIRPKAPDFSKFRPKPPVPGAAHNSSAPLPVPETLPTGVTAEAVAHQQNAQPSTAGLNNDLLTQIKSLTDKIAALEGQIIEQEKERTFSTPIPSSEFNSEETFVSEPQNEQEDDVLEVPFDNDFEVPFDANKSSEEIAKEAEAMLSKPMTTEIEEFNTDDQGTEGIDYGSDMQKMLEDTIRTTLYKPQNDKQNKDAGNKKRTFIAEDLISKTTYRFSDKEAPEKVNEKPAEQKAEEAEKEATAKNISLEEQQKGNEGQEASQEEVFKEEPSQENANEDIIEESNNQEQEEIIESGKEEKVQSLDDLLEGPSSEEPANELLENNEQENPSEDVPPQENGEEEKEEENLEEAQQEETAEEAEQEDIQEEVKADAQLASLNAIPAVNDVETKQEEPKHKEVKADIQLSSLGSVPEKQTEEPVQEEEKEQEIEEQNQEPEEGIQADITTEENNEDAPVKIDQEEEKEESMVSLPDVDDDKQEDIKINKVEEEKESENSDNKEEPVVEELSAEELKMDELVSADEQDQYLKTVALDNFDTDASNMTERLQVPADSKPEEEPEETESEQTEPEISEDIQEENNQEDKQEVQSQELSSEEELQELKVKEDTLQEENVKENIEEEIKQKEVEQDIQLQELSPIDERENIETEKEDNTETSSNTLENLSNEVENTPPEDTANLSVTRVTISEDDTTAAVLDEIAQEKAHSSTSTSTSSNKLFEELEKTYKEENKFADNTSESSSGDDVSSDEAKPQEGLDNDFAANSDEFLKTFTTSVEEVFLDQPTAIISDYVPPSGDTEDVDHGRLPSSDNGIKRAKPSDIKTVPLVPEVMGQEIHSSPYVESATAKLGKKSALKNLFYWILTILGISAIIIIMLSGLAFFGIIPERFSIIHNVINSYETTHKENDATVNEDLSPEIVQETMPSEQNYQDEQNQESAILEKVKNYAFNDGTTLQSRIRYSHQNLSGEIEWTLFPTEEQNVYSVAVKIPQNTGGQGFSYRFNYNVAGDVLTPTTSGAKNIIENFSR